MNHNLAAINIFQLPLLFKLNASMPQYFNIQYQNIYMGPSAMKSMPKDQKSEGKDHKEEEKHGEDKAKWEKDPLAGAFVGLVLIMLGAAYIGRSYLPDPDLWFAWFLVGAGVVFLLDALVHSMKPEWKRPVFGKVVLGIVLMCLGGGAIMGFEDWWAFLLVGLGVIFLIYYIGKIYRT